MPRRALRLTLATAVVGTALLPAITPPSYAGPPAAATPAALAVTVGSVTPAVALNGATLTVVANVRNLGSSPVSGVTVTVRDGSTPVTTRAEVAAWAASRTPATGAVLAKGSVPGSIAAGAGASVRLTVSDVAAERTEKWGAVPVSVEATAGPAGAADSSDTAGAGDERVHTFLGYQVVKQYVPLTTAVLLPLVLDPDPDLAGTGTARADAWTAATAPTSRLGRIVAGAAATSASFVLDPALTATPQVLATTTTQTTTTSPTDPTHLATYAASTAELQTRTDLAARIDSDPATASTGSPASTDRLLLPMGDPDIAAPTERQNVSAAVRATAEAGLASSGPTVAWPAGGAWSAPIEATVRAAYGPDLRVALVSSAWLRAGDRTAEANERTDTGLPLAVYDAPLSGLLDRATKGAGALALQQFVADSAALVAERSGTERELLLVGSRGLDPSPADLGRLLQGIGSGVPWVSTVGARSVVVDGSATPAELPLAELATSPPRTPATLLTPQAASRLAGTGTTVRAMAAVRSDGEGFAAPLLQAGQQLLATSWRTAPGRWGTLDTSVTRAATSGASGVFVSPRQINFLADSGRIQITVVNDLDVAVHDLTLTLHPDNPRLRIESPTTSVTIGARSRTTRIFRATALAAGPVPITATLTAPDGTVIRRDAPVRISVTPTGDWMYWVLGVIAGTILVVGIWRGVRRGRPGTLPHAEAVEEHVQ